MKLKEDILLAVEKGYKVTEEGDVLSPRGKRKLFKDRTGRYYFSIKRFNGQVGKIYVHRLQGYQKFGDKIFNPEFQIRHFDGNEINNSNVNILIGTPSQNMMDIPADVRQTHAKLASSYKRRFTDEEIAKMRKEVKDGATCKEIREKYKLAKSVYHYIIRKPVY